MQWDVATLHRQDGVSNLRSALAFATAAIPRRPAGVGSFGHGASVRRRSLRRGRPAATPGTARARGGPRSRAAAYRDGRRLPRSPDLARPASGLRLCPNPSRPSRDRRERVPSGLSRSGQPVAGRSNVWVSCVGVGSPLPRDRREWLKWRCHTSQRFRGTRRCLPLPSLVPL
jgi:hypothetical protein